jgi:FecR-like protein
MNAPKQLSDGAVERLLNIAGPRPEPSASAAERVRAAVHDEWQREVASRRFLRRVYAAASVAAAAMLAAVVFLFLPRTTPRPAPFAGPVASLERTTGTVHVRGIDGSIRVAVAGDRIEATSEIETADDSRAAFRLIDGSSVRIDSGSRVKFERHRSFTLEHGAMYVDATRSGIEIRTRYGVARDIGTRFEVRLRNAVVDVRVRDGIVTFDRGGQVHAGEQLRVTPEGSLSRSVISRYGGDWEWTMDIAPPFALDGKTVAEFVQWAEGETGLSAKYRSAAVQRLASSTVLHGSVRELRPDVACTAILPTAGLRCTAHDGLLDIAGGGR